MMMHVRPIEKWQNSPPLKYSNRCGTIYNLYGKITHGLLPWALKKYLVAAAHAAIQVCGVWLPWSTVVRCRVTKVYWQSISLTWIWFVLAYCCRLSNESSLPTDYFQMAAWNHFTQWQCPSIFMIQKMYKVLYFKSDHRVRYRYKSMTCGCKTTVVSLVFI